MASSARQGDDRRRRIGNGWRDALGVFCLLAACAASACSLVFERPEVRVAEVRLGSIGLTGGTVDLAVDVANSNGFDLVAEAFRYEVDFADNESDASDDWKRLAEGEVERVVRVTANDSACVELSVPFSHKQVGSALLRLLRNRELHYRFRGDVLFDTPVGAMWVPFDRTGLVRP